MRIPEPNEGGNFTPPPAGTHAAICYRFIDLGTQPVEYMGETKEPKRKVLISWELPLEMMDTDDGPRPFTIHKKYTWSMHEKAQLRKDLESWRGRRFTEQDFGVFDTKNLIGVPCMLSVIHNDKNGTTYANLSGISGLPKGMEKPRPVNPAFYLSLDPAEFKRDLFEQLSDNLKDQIRHSPEWAELNKPSNGNGSPAHESFEIDDEIPF